MKKSEPQHAWRFFCFKGYTVSIAIFFLFGLVTASAQTPLQPGIQLLDAGKFAQAEEFFSDVAKREPANHAALYYFARSIGERDGARMQRLDERRKWIEKAVKLQPNNSDYHLWYGHALGAIALHSVPGGVGGSAAPCRSEEGIGAGQQVDR